MLLCTNYILHIQTYHIFRKRTIDLLKNTRSYDIYRDTSINNLILLYAGIMKEKHTSVKNEYKKFRGSKDRKSVV